MGFPSKQHTLSALTLPGFDRWRPLVDVPELHRPRSRPKELPGSGSVAAVMVLIYECEVAGRPTLTLTQRNASLSKHASQISFPGGSQDAGETLQETALRETQEEIGVLSADIEVLGQLNSVYIPPTDFEVTPFVGWHQGSPKFVRSEREVAQIIEVPLSHLLNPSALVFGDVLHANGQSLRVPFYDVTPHQVWGATAIMLGELIERLTRVFENRD